MKEKNELPEVLEFLKTTRILIRQLKIFKKIEICEENRDLLKQAVEKAKVSIDSYLEGE